MPARPTPKTPLFAAIMEEAARVRREDVRLDLEDPALLALVERAVAHWANALTPEGLEEVRRFAKIALATHSDIDAFLSREDQPLADGSGVRPKRSPDRLLDVVARHARRQGSR